MYIYIYIYIYIERERERERESTLSLLALVDVRLYCRELLKRLLHCGEGVLGTAHGMSHVTRLKSSYSYTFQSVPAHVSTSHVTHINQSVPAHI